MVGLPWIYDDGGRERAGYKGSAGDCVVRSIAIFLRMPYAEVYDELFRRQKLWLRTSRSLAAQRTHSSSPRDGVHPMVYKPWLDEMDDVTWHPQMKVGDPARVHLAVGEIPEVGMIVESHGLAITIRKVDGNAVEEVEVTSKE